MKKFKKNPIVIALIVSFMFMFGFTSPSSVLAATTPSLGTAAPYGILSSTFTRNVGLTAITGDLGYTTLSGSGTDTVTGLTVVTPPGQAGTDQGTALANLTSLGTNVLLAGTYTPGCYSSSGTMDITLGTTVTLSGAGTYIFRSGGAITTGANSIIALANGASSCDVFWTPNGDTTLGANSTFIGTDIPVAQDIYVGHLVSWLGRALTFGHTVTTDTDTISSLCTTAPVTPAVSGGLPLVAQVPPLINIVKIPTLLSLSAGGGVVAYDYTVSNTGTVAMSNVTVTDDKCAPVNFISGDINNDSKLNVNETWKYRCTATVLQTTANTATATGQANGFTAIDTANAMVVVGVPIIPPLIHVVKKPSVFLLPAGGGAVTYTYTVTNPGTAPLSNVTITDDKCTGLPGRVVGHPGDLNKNDLLESNESWSFTCQTNLTQTTTNTGVAYGTANGLIATDFSLATVAVTPPKLPKTGFPPKEESTIWNIIIQKLYSFFF